ncbi:hypothetical protein C8F01DRAFT_1105546 [Mycena amicta]|nr:hypothetical protein C8F01DRAFT_1105546 [Mycena amicta]
MSLWALDLTAPPLPPTSRPQIETRSSSQKHKTRRFPEDARRLLEAVWSETHNPTIAQRNALLERLRLVRGEEECTEPRIKRWFASQRKKLRPKITKPPQPSLEHDLNLHVLPQWNRRYPSLTPRTLDQMQSAWDSVPEGSRHMLRDHWLKDSSWPDADKADKRRWLDDHIYGYTEPASTSGSAAVAVDVDMQDDSSDEEDRSDQIPLSVLYPRRSRMDDEYRPTPTPAPPAFVRYRDLAYLPPTPTSTRAPSLALKPEPDASPIASYSPLPTIATLPQPQSPGSPSSSYGYRSISRSRSPSPPLVVDSESRASSIFSPRQSPVTPAASLPPRSRVLLETTTWTISRTTTIADHTPPPEPAPVPLNHHRSRASSPPSQPSSGPVDPLLYLKSIHDSIKDGPPKIERLPTNSREFDALYEPHMEMMTSLLARLKRDTARR